MEPILILLYLAAGGIVTLLMHIFFHISRSHDKKYSDSAAESKSILWKLFSLLHGIVLILSVIFILPCICIFFDARYTCEAVDEADRADKISSFNSILLKTIEEKDARIKELENSYDNLLLKDTHPQIALKLISKYAAESDMPIKAYCRYCLTKGYMSDGEDGIDAKERAEAAIPDDLSDADAAYKVVKDLARRSNLSISEYFVFCKNQQ